MKNIIIFLLLAFLFSACNAQPYQVRKIAQVTKNSDLSVKASASYDVSVMSAQQVIPSLKNCLGLEDKYLDSGIFNKYKELQSAFAEGSDVKKISSQYLQSLIVLAGEFCKRTIDQENTKDVRSFFKGFSLGGKNSEALNIYNTASLLTNACLYRDPAQTELDEFNAAFKNEFSSTANSAFALYLCTSLLGTYDFSKN